MHCIILYFVATCERPFVAEYNEINKIKPIIYNVLGWTGGTCYLLMKISQPRTYFLTSDVGSLFH